MSKRKITSRRSTRSPASVAPSQKRDPWGCMAGTVVIVPGTDLTAPSEERWNAEEARLPIRRGAHDAR